MNNETDGYYYVDEKMGMIFLIKALIFAIVPVALFHLIIIAMGYVAKYLF